MDERTTADGAAWRRAEDTVAAAEVAARGALDRGRAFAPAERAAIAAALGLEALDAFAYTMRLEARSDGGVDVAGRVTARLTQACVVTLEPVAATIDEALRRELLPPDVYASRMAALEGDADADDGFDDDDDVVVLADDGAEDVEPLDGPAETARVDLAAIALEALALAIDPYPRAPGSRFDGVVAGPPGAAAMTDADAKPFAPLATLKRRLEGPDPARDEAEGDDGPDGAEGGGDSA